MHCVKFKMLLAWSILITVLTGSVSSNVKQASVTYDQLSQKFLILDYIAINCIAYGRFKNEIYQTGWSNLEVYTNENFLDPMQAYAAGLVEGYLTRDLIKDHQYNLVSDYCVDNQEYCERLKTFIEKNLSFIKDNVYLKRTHDTYWHQVGLLLEQLHGVEDMFMNKISHPSIDIDSMGLILLNLPGDLGDLEIVLERNESSSLAGPSCSVLVKVLPNNLDVLVGHSSWTTYNWMTRILKKYNFKFHNTLSEGSPLIYNQAVSFSSYPGALSSIDDFYVLSSGLAVFETSIDNLNPSLWKFVNPENIILSWQRAMIANRLAQTGEQWTSIFSILNSGTCNNQWNVLDYGRFQSGQPLPDGLLWTLEQMPGFVHAEDLTSILRKQSYFPSYNVAYFKDIFNMSIFQEDVDKYGDYYSYERAPRALIFKRDHHKVTDIQSLVKLLRYNNYTKEPFSRCDCTPPYSADRTISSRRDLNPINGTYPFTLLGHACDGGTDTKATSSDLIKNLQFWALSGPTYEDVPPFQWSKSDCGKALKHRGMPDLWMFQPVLNTRI